MANTLITIKFEDRNSIYVVRELIFIGKTFDELFDPDLILERSSQNSARLNQQSEIDVIPIPFPKDIFDNYISLRKLALIQGILPEICTVKLYQLECYLQVYKNIFDLEILITSCNVSQICLKDIEWDHLEKLIKHKKCDGTVITKYYEDMSHSILSCVDNLVSLPLEIFQKIGLYLLIYIFTSEYSDYSTKYAAQCTNLFTKYINDTEFIPDYIPPLSSLISILPLVDETINAILIYKIIQD